MPIAVTGATGPFGRFVVESLIERGVPAADITATGRSVARIDDLAAAGVRVVASDYDDPASLDAAFAGADVLVLVSASEIGKRLLEAAITRARALGFDRIELETNSRLLEAIALYRRYGFQPIEGQHLASRCDQNFELRLTE